MPSRTRTPKKIDKEKVEQMAKRLRFCRVLTGKTLREFASTANINHVTLSRYERGITAIKDNNIDRIINLLLSQDIIFSQRWLIDGIGDWPVLKEKSQKQGSELELIPYEISEQLETVVTPLFLKDRLNEAFYTNKEMNFFEKNIPGSIVRYVEDDSMLPIFKKGEYVVGIKIGTEEMEKVNGEYCIVMLKNKTVIRQFFTKKKLTSLVCVNVNSYPDPIYIDGYPEMVAPILYHRKLLKFN